MINYNNTVNDCFFSPQHVGVVKAVSMKTTYFSTANITSKATIKLSMHCNELHEVQAMRFKTNGTPYVIAALEWLCRQSINKQLTELTVNYAQLVTILDVPFNQVPSMIQVQEAYKELIQQMNKQLEGGS